MRLLLFALIWRGWCFATDSDNLVDVTGETVKQVEALLAKDPNLPRLTRGEIISLIEEVKNVSDSKGDNSLLVVMPFNGTGPTQLEDLYTKRPVTKLIGEPITTKRPKRRRKPTQPRPVYVHSTEFSSTESSVASSSSEYTTTTPLSTPSYQSSKISASFNQEGVQPKPYQENLSLPKPFQEALHDISASPEAEKDFVFVTPTTTRGTAAPVPLDVANTAEALTPDLKNVLNSIGIIGNKATEKPTFQLKAMAPSTDVSSYSRFKPLPSGSDVSDDMKSFLKSFGLLEPSRQKKAMREPPKQDDSLINEDILTDDMKNILKNIGLLGRQSKKVHIFNPQLESSKLNETEHMLKINKILKKLREISDGNNQDLSQEELKELLLLEAGEDANKTLLETNLDPGLLSPDQYQNLEAVKNEVKRQQPNITEGAFASASATAVASDSASATASASASALASAGGTESATDTTESVLTTESPLPFTAEDSIGASSDATERSPSLDDLADSFGGVIPEVSTKRPNGFYFLLDWNSFLDVGLDDRKVSVNFSPKVGDPRNFLPVRIP